MKRQFLLLVALAVFATALTTTATGQTATTLRVNIKFDFQIGDLTYPAGEYRISPEPNNVLQIRNVSDANKKQFIVANHSNAGKVQTPKLVFQRYGESYFLTQVLLDCGEFRAVSARAKSTWLLASLETIEVRLAN